MVAKHKITLEDYHESYGLIGLYTGLQPYSLAFALNEELSMKLMRTDNDQKCNGASFSLFEWYDASHDCQFILFENKKKVNSAEPNMVGSLFSNEVFYRTTYLVEEKKQIDFFLRIDHEETVDVDKMTNKIKAMPKITMAQTIVYESLKSKENLILLSNAN